MTSTPHQVGAVERVDGYRRLPISQAPFMHAPEAARTIFLVTATAAACGPLLGGLFFFGWRAVHLTLVAMISCVTIEWLYFRVTRTPSLLGRSHAALTGILLALTLPPFAPWHVAVIGAAFAIIVGKGVFGGVGHFVWQPALVGRLVVALMFPALAVGPSSAFPDQWPILPRNKVVVGDINNYRATKDYRRWEDRRSPPRADAMLVTRPEAHLAPLTRGKAAFSALARAPLGLDRLMPAALLTMPSPKDLLLGAVPGGIGETSTVLIIIAGLYLIYRNFTRWQLPASILVAAAAVLAIAPIHLVTDREFTVWHPITYEGVDVGMLYVIQHLASGGLVLSAFFLATEMTTRPITMKGQVLYGAGIGVLAMLLRLYTRFPLPCYMAVLVMNTFSLTIDRLWRPRAFGVTRWAALTKWHVRA